MSSSRVKIPVFDRINYNLWKKKMTLFLQVANPKYLGILKNGLKTPMVTEQEVALDGVVVIVEMKYPKDPNDYTPTEKEEAALDMNL